MIYDREETAATSGLGCSLGLLSAALRMLFSSCFFPLFHLSHNHLDVKEVRTDIKKHSATGFINEDLVLWFRGVVSFQFDPRLHTCDPTWVNSGSGQCS